MQFSGRIDLIIYINGTNLMSSNYIYGSTHSIFVYKCIRHFVCLLLKFENIVILVIGLYIIEISNFNIIISNKN